MKVVINVFYRKPVFICENLWLLLFPDHTSLFQIIDDEIKTFFVFANQFRREHSFFFE